MKPSSREFNPSRSELAFRGSTKTMGSHRYPSVGDDSHHSKKVQAAAVLEVLEILRASTRGTNYETQNDNETTRAEVVLDKKNKKIRISPLPSKQPSTTNLLMESRSQEQSPASSPSSSCSSSLGKDPKGLSPFHRKKGDQKSKLGRVRTEQRTAVPSSSVTASSLDAAMMRRRKKSIERKRNKDSKGGRSESEPPVAGTRKQSHGSKIPLEAKSSFHQESHASLGDFHIPGPKSHKSKKSLDRKIKRDRQRHYEQQMSFDWSFAETSNSAETAPSSNSSNFFSEPFAKKGSSQSLTQNQRTLPLSKSNLQKVSSARLVGSERGPRTTMAIKSPQSASLPPSRKKRISFSTQLSTEGGSTISAPPKFGGNTISSSLRPSKFQTEKVTFSSGSKNPIDSKSPRKSRRDIATAHSSSPPPPPLVKETPIPSKVTTTRRVSSIPKDATFQRTSPVTHSPRTNESPSSLSSSTSSPPPPVVGSRDKLSTQDSIGTNETADLSSLESSSQHSQSGDCSASGNDELEKESRGPIPDVSFSKGNAKEGGDAATAGGKVKNHRTQEEYTGFFLLSTSDGNLKHGYGRTKFPDGRVFEGTYDHGVMVEGKMTYPPQVDVTTSTKFRPTYLGRFDASGQKTGKGIYTTARTTFLGAFEKDLMHGSGMLIYNDETNTEDRTIKSSNGACYHGRRFVGHWEEGLRHGYGKELRIDGSVQREGFWKNDRFVGTTAPRTPLEP